MPVLPSHRTSVSKRHVPSCTVARRSDLVFGEPGHASHFLETHSCGCCLYSSKEASAKGKIWCRERHAACDSARAVFSDALDAAPFHGLNTVPSWSRTTRMMTWFWPRCVSGKRLLLSLLNVHGALARFPMHASFGSRKKRTLVACAWAPVSFLWNP